MVYPPVGMHEHYIDSIIFERIGEEKYLVVLDKSGSESTLIGYKYDKLYAEICWVFPDYMMRALGVCHPFHICKYTPGQILICNETMRNFMVQAYLSKPENASGATPFKCNLVSFCIEDGKLSESQLDANENDTKIDSPSLLSWNVETSYLATVDTMTNVISMRHIDIDKVVDTSEPRECGLPSCDITTEDQELKKCSRCHKVAYCSKEHQSQHWREHKRSCTSTVGNT